MANDDELIGKINELRKKGETYEGIAEQCEVSGALIWKISRGKCSSDKVRRAFGLPPKLVEVTPCAICGEVHLQKTCAARRDTRPRYRLALEFASKSERDECARLMALYLAPDRAEQSRRILDTLRRFNEFGRLP